MKKKIIKIYFIVSLVEYYDNIENEVVSVTVHNCATQYGGESRKSRRRRSSSEREREREKERERRELSTTL
jgi:hypothetical protein